MNVNNFLKLHDGGVACISINEENGYKYFEEWNQEEMQQTETYKKIKNRQVKRFCVINDGERIIELIIELKEMKGSSGNK
jgi:hypothetical protein